MMIFVCFLIVKPLIKEDFSMYRHLFPVVDDETVMQALARRLSRQGLQAKTDERGLVFGEFVWQKQATHLWRVRHQKSLMWPASEACDVILIWHPLGELYGWRLLVGGDDEPAAVLAVFNALAPQTGAYLKLGDLASVAFCADLIQQCGVAFEILTAQCEATLKQNAQAFSAEKLADLWACIQVNTHLLLALQRDARAYLQTSYAKQPLDFDAKCQHAAKSTTPNLAQHLAQFLLSIPVPTLGELS
jgi:hypothetical protein